MEAKPEINRIDVVLLGDFNPKIFSPAWLAAHDLIGEQESEDANIEIIHSDVAIFSLPWFRAQITRDRFSIFTEQEAYFGILYDLVSHAFKILEHTPIHTFGYNWGMHFKCNSEEEWHGFGHYVAPPKIWTGILENPALFRLEMTEKYPPSDLLDGTMKIRVEPSRRINLGVFININHHFAVPEKESVRGCRLIMSKFEENWENSRKKSEELIYQLLGNFEETI
jgi:hypothetical protein